MFYKTKSLSDISEMGCCSCFGFFSSKPKRSLKAGSGFLKRHSQECLLTDNLSDMDGVIYNDEATDNLHDSDGEARSRAKRSEEILLFRVKNGMICREVPVKESHRLIRSEDENGNKMINEYVRECKIAFGSYAKVALYRSQEDGKQYAIKVFHKSHLLKQRVTPSETAMTDVLREVLIMKMLGHPNIVNLVEVIDDPNDDNFYMVLEFIESKWFCEGSGSLDGLGASAARKYLRDVVAGLMYIHAHNIVHGDIKPDNLLVSSTGNVKIGDFSVSQVVEEGNDELRRSPGTPVFTAPECCLGLTYHGKAADTWALGMTLYRMMFGYYPFIGETLQDTYDKIVNNPLIIPDDIDPQLHNLVEGILNKDPTQRLTLNAVASHPWVVGEEGPIPEYLCLCKRTNNLTSKNLPDDVIR